MLPDREIREIKSPAKCCWKVRENPHEKSATHEIDNKKFKTYGSTVDLIITWLVN